jgi:hypothetical protein
MVSEPENLAEAIRRRFARYGGVELELPKRELAPDPPDFGESDTTDQAHAPENERSS